MNMTSRERVLLALDHKQPDRIPIDIGGLSNLTSLHVSAYERLILRLGFTEEIQISSYTHQSVFISDQVRKRFHSDTYPIFFPYRPDDEAYSEDGSCTFTDEWGCRWKKPCGGYYYDRISTPLSGLKLEEIKRHMPPVHCSDDDILSLLPGAETARQQGLFTILNMPQSGAIYTLAQRLYGYENFFVTMLTDPEIAHVLVDLALDYQLKFLESALRLLPGLIDGVVVSDDLATQTAPIAGMEQYLEFVKPAHQKFTSVLHSKGIKAIYHCCGAASSFIGQMKEAGFSAWNPVQVSAVGNGDTQLLKGRFGDKITFWGGICDNQSSLVKHSPEQIREEVGRRMSDLSPSGGFIAASIHNIQPDVPTENIIALYDGMWQG